MRLIDADAFKEYICNAYEQVKHMYPDGGEWARQITEDFCKDIDDQPTVETESQWIPCSKRLPCDGIPVNITWVNRKPVSYYADIKDKPFAATGIYYRGKWFWYSCLCEDLLYEYGYSKADIVDDEVEIIAWMPLPEPWKGEEE